MKPPKNFYSNLDRRKQGLPEVPEASAADAGKVIKVGSGGDYELASDAGSIVMIVTLASNYTADKTYNEILAALNNGDIVKLVDWTGRNYIYSGMTSGRICFAYLNGYSNTNELDVFTVAVDDTNAWELFLDTITNLPDYSSSDNGKFLGVDSNGDLEFANVPNELPAVSSADAGKVLTVDSNGAWGADNIKNKIHYVDISIAGTLVLLPTGITKSIIINWLENGDIVFLKDNERKVYVIQNWGIPNIDNAKYSFNCLEFTDTTITVSRVSIGITNIVYYTHTYSFA